MQANKNGIKFHVCERRVVTVAVLWNYLKFCCCFFFSLNGYILFCFILYEMIMFNVILYSVVKLNICYREGERELPTCA